MQLLVTPGLILAYSPEHRQVMITIMKPHTASSPILQIYCTLCSGSEEHLMRDTREHKSIPSCYNQRVSHCSPARGGVSNYLFSWRINTNNYPGEGALSQGHLPSASLGLASQRQRCAFFPAIWRPPSNMAYSCFLRAKNKYFKQHVSVAYFNQMKRRR